MRHIIKYMYNRRKGIIHNDLIKY